MAVRTQPLAFPGATGYGKNALGGSGGTVMFVTNLNDSGAGSLRAAFESSGARIVIPLVSGRINVSSPITISNPYLSYFGHYGTGTGITLSRNNQTGPVLEVRSHNIILRYLKSRHSVDYVSTQSADSCRVIGSDAHDIIIDHCSFSWAPDGNLDCTEGAYNVTIQNCILYQCLASEKNSLNKYNDTRRLTFYRNVFSSTDQRNPAIASSVGEYADDTGILTEFEVINNLIFRFEYATTFPREYPANLNWMGNRLLYERNKRRGLFCSNFATINGATPADRVQVHMRGNTDDKWRLTVSDPVDWDEEFSLSQGTSGSAYEDDPPQGWVEGTNGIYYRIPPQFRRLTPHDTPIITDGTQILDAGIAGNEVLWDDLKQTVGASLPQRDTADIEVIDNIDAYIASGYDKVTWGGANPKKNASGDNVFPSAIANNPPTDNNGDGIPDSWASANMGGETANDLAPSGYTWIEEYHNELAGNQLANIPVVTCNTNCGDLVVEVGDPTSAYSPMIGTWTDVEDGSGSAILAGDTVDINTVGTYSQYLEYTDLNGNTGISSSRTIEVVPEIVNVTGVNVSPTTLSIQEGNTQTLTLTFNPTNPTDTTGVWISGDENIATVNSSGLVTAGNPGATTITFTSNDGGFSDSTTVTVEPLPNPVSENWVGINSVVRSGSDYVINFSLPVNSLAPDGGYDTVIDGVDQGDHASYTGFTRTIIGLDTNVSHTFRLEARYTQLEPSIFPRTNTVTVNPSTGATPTITRTDSNPTTYTVGDTLPNPIVEGTWTDAEDGSGTATLGGDTVDVNTVGVYNVTLSHTDLDGNTATLNIPITVIPIGNTLYPIVSGDRVKGRREIRNLIKKGIL